MTNVYMYTNVSHLNNTCTPKNWITYICMFTKFMNTCKAAEVGDGGAVDKSVGMRTSVCCESVGMWGSILWH